MISGSKEYSTWIASCSAQLEDFGQEASQTINDFVTEGRRHQLRELRRGERRSLPSLELGSHWSKCSNCLAFTHWLPEARGLHAVNKQVLIEHP